MTEGLRRRHDQRRGAPPATETVRETALAGWNTLVVGRPSGAQPFFERERAGHAREAGEPRARAPRGQASRPSGAKRSAEAPTLVTRAAHLPAPLPQFEPDFEIVVRAGDVLSKLCEGHYRSRPEEMKLHDVVGAVARYNDLSSADGVRAGQVIRLPDIRRFTKD